MLKKIAISITICLFFAQAAAGPIQVDAWSLTNKAREEKFTIQESTLDEVILPFDMYDSAEQGVSRAESWYDFWVHNDSAIFKFDCEHIRSALYSSGGQLFVDMNFTLTQEIPYRLTGQYTTTGAAVTSMTLTLTNTSTETVVFHNLQRSRNTDNQFFLLGMQQGDEANELEGSQFGTLPAGQYHLYFYLGKDSSSIQQEYGTGTGIMEIKLGQHLDRGKIYWTNEGTNNLYQSNLDGTERVTIYSSIPILRDITVDVPEAQIYWIGNNETINRKIYRANLDGTQQEDYITGLALPIGLELYKSGSAFYWTESKSIYRKDMITHQIRRLIYGPNYPWGISIDHTEEKLYWSVLFDQKIQKANLDGSDIEDVITGISDLRDLEVDSKNKIYFLTAGRVKRANLDGTGVESLSPYLNGCQYLELDRLGSKLYWTNADYRKITKVNFDGTGLEELLSGFEYPIGIGLYVNNSIAGPDAFGYTAKTISNGLRDIESTGTAVSLTGVEASDSIGLPFAFNYYGEEMTSLRIGANGFITFDDGAITGSAGGRVFPDPNGFNGIIAGCWGDLLPETGGVCYQSLGAVGDREFVVGFYDVAQYTGGGNVTFEMILHERTNNIELQIDTAAGVDGTVNAAIGIENMDGSDGLTLAYGNSIDYSGRSVMFTHPCQYYLAGDNNRDCRVDLLDLAVVAGNWLVDCKVDPYHPSCL